MWSDTGSYEYASRGDQRKIINLDSYNLADPVKSSRAMEPSIGGSSTSSAVKNNNSNNRNSNMVGGSSNRQQQQQAVGVRPSTYA